MGIKHYIYALCCPDTKEVKYIGQSINPKSRLRGHINEARRNKFPNRLKDIWVRDLLLQKKKPILKIIEECSLETWQGREKYWISSYGRENLLNSSDGGEYSLTQWNSDNFPLEETCEEGYTSGQVAQVFEISQSSLNEWETKGYIKSFRNHLGHRRFSEEEIYRMEIFLSEYQRISEAAEKLNLDVRYIRKLEERGIIKLFRGDSSYILIHNDEVEKIRQFEEEKKKEKEQEESISFSVKEAAKEIGVSNASMKKMVRENMIEVFSGNRGFNRISNKEIERLKKEREVVHYSKYLMNVSREIGCNYTSLYNYEKYGHIKIIRLPFDRDRILEEDIPKIKELYAEGKKKAHLKKS